jgi:TldD protein
LEDIARYALNYALSHEANYAEVRLQRDNGSAALLKNGNPEVSSLIKNYGIGIRVLAHGSMGFASTNILDRENVSKCILEAISMAKSVSGRLRKNIDFSSNLVSNEKWNVTPKVDVNSIGFDEKFELLLDIEKATISSCNDFKMPNRLFIIESEETEKIFLNSEGSSIQSSVPRVSFTYILTAYKAGKGTAQRFNQKGETKGWEVINEWNLINFVADEARILGKILKQAIAPPKNDQLDILLGSEVVGIICHESCGHPFEADRIIGREAAEAGESFISPEMQGQKIGSDAVTVVDDPTLPNSYGFYLYDDEGVKARRRDLIKNGFINTFLHNRETAIEFEVETNGSSRSEAYNKEPIIRMANTYMDPGDYKLDELLEDISYGIFMKNFMEWNIDDKRFNQRYVGLEAYEIIKGELKKLIRNPILEITTPALYSSVDAVGKDLSFNAAICGKGDPQQGVPVWTGGPSIRVRKMRLGGLP